MFWTISAEGIRLNQCKKQCHFRGVVTLISLRKVWAHDRDARVGQDDAPSLHY